MPYKYMATGKDLFVLSNKAKAQEQQRPLLKSLYSKVRNLPFCPVSCSLDPTTNSKISLAGILTFFRIKINKKNGKKL